MLLLHQIEPELWEPWFLVQDLQLIIKMLSLRQIDILSL